MKTKLELLGRTLLIYLSTILVGSIFSAIYLTIIDFEQSVEFSSYFIAGVLITGLISIPSLLILFIGFFLIYKKCKNNTQKWRYITLVWLLNCYAPIFIAISLLFNKSDPIGTQLFFASIPFIFISFISIFSFTYYFDKRKPPVFQERKKVINDDILDAPFE